MILLIKVSDSLRSEFPLYESVYITVSESAWNFPFSSENRANPSAYEALPDLRGVGQLVLESLARPQTEIVADGSVFRSSKTTEGPASRLRLVPRVLTR